jgi:phosphoglycolate phosphatase-like HAD superfamily hydrolase
MSALATPQPLTAPPRALIFDLDGVIFDSLAANVAFYNHILEAIGRPPRAEEAIDIIHRDPMDRSLEALVGRGPDFDRAMAYWRTMDSAPFLKLLSLYPHVRETLDELSGRLTLAVATNRTLTARSSLARFELLSFFAEVVTPLDSGAPKPDPAMMGLLLGRLGLTPEDVVYVGDTGADEGMCVGSGVRLIAFRNRELAAWAHVQDFREIPPLLGL